MTASRTQPRWSKLASRHRRLLIAGLGLVLVYALVSLVAGQLFGGGNASQASAMRRWLVGFGSAAPLVFIALQTLQVLFAPIPGQITALVGGYAFGWRAGLTYSMIGLAIGSFVAMWLSRRYGRPLVAALHAERAVEDIQKLLGGERKTSVKQSRFYNWFAERGEFMFFLIMLLPLLPDDVACFAAGLTRIALWRLMIAALLGRLPGMLVLSMLGDGESTWTVRVALIVVVVVACGCSYLLFRRAKTKRANPTTTVPSRAHRA